MPQVFLFLTFLHPRYQIENIEFLELNFLEICIKFLACLARDIFSLFWELKKKQYKR